MNTLSIPYPPEILSALEQDPAAFEAEARLLLAVKLYETGKLTTGLAAQLAGISREAFWRLLGRHDLSPFGAEPGDLERDLEDARRAGRSG